ncbi:NAD(P)H-binding protein [Kribbella sp. NPDC049174]|uniref:NAD(P)H-binding protein n=1 Tax=Kribbella sp. NPDC049174 TaxID=3364112 RepID=UPI00371876B6
MILVTGATGILGRLVVDRLLDRLPATDVAVIVRDPDQAAEVAARGVDVRRGDYDDPDGLRAAFAGAGTVLFISAPVTVSGRLEQHRNVVRAAAAAEVGRIAYTSGLGADFVDEGVLGEHHQTEEWIAESGLPAVILRHPIYSELYINPGLQTAIEAGELTSSTGGRGLNTATRADLAEAAAAAVTATEVSATYNFTGSVWTYPELAEVLGEVSGRPVAYREVESEEGFLGALAEVIRAGGFEVQTDDLERLLGRPPMSLRGTVLAALPALQRP